MAETDMNGLQKKEWELLKCFTEVCQRLGLTYYLVCGSALGAVKYGGFIPWDDDVDVGMLREDYEIFLEKAPALLPEHIFLQNYRTDPAFPAIFSKLRDSNTTYIECTAARLPIHHGIYMDIFPLDGYPARKWDRWKLEGTKKICRGLLMAAFLPRHPWRRPFALCLQYLGLGKCTARIARYYERAVSRYPASGAAILASHGGWQGKLDYAPAAYYGFGTWGTFEGLEVRLPERGDDYLRRKYGDYTLDPPPEEQKGHHLYTVCDCGRPYGDYL